MEKIIFKGIDDHALSKLKEVFEELKEGKRNGRINATKIKNIIGPLYETKFCHSVGQELAQTKKDGPEEHWDFKSWIEAIQNSDIALLEVKVLDGSQYELSLNQNNWPSGGIECMERLIKIFDAEIVENTMI